MSDYTNIIGKSTYFFSQLLTFFIALNPRIENITMLAYIAVIALQTDTRSTSLTQLFFGVLYEPNAIREPKASPKL